jgi:hypothetical protein
MNQDEQNDQKSETVRHTDLKRAEELSFKTLLVRFYLRNCPPKEEEGPAAQRP